MEKYIIEGGSPLEGKLQVGSSKNSILPLLAASILTEEIVTIENPPMIADFFVMVEIMKEMGCKVKLSAQYITIDSSNCHKFEISKTLAKELRSSIFLMGSILARFKKAVLAYPGGCDIGLRPIDLHIEGLKSLGVKFLEEGGNIFADGSEMKGGHVMLDFPSVGATENIIMAASMACGETVIENPAKEPEITDLIDFINAMGGKIRITRDCKIHITGVKKLHGCTHKPIPDRIVAGTYLIATAITKGEIELSGVNSEHIASLLTKLRETACKIRCVHDRIYLKAPKNLKSLRQISTSPYPGFPTDMQPQMMALMSVARGIGVIEEKMFETRFRHASELRKMGADITVKDRTAIICGVEKLKGAEVFAYDLRGGACMVLAGLVAEGETVVRDIRHIQRGYANLESDLSVLGAKIKREVEDEKQKNIICSEYTDCNSSVGVSGVMLAVPSEVF
ncbi:MAG: UDP-N-acetylglucosamine 1-carboxyvinyltransferase [Bacillota bacterium]